MSRINIKYIADDTLETLRRNLDHNLDNFINNTYDGSWIQSLTPGKTFIEKKYTIEDFALEVPESSRDKNTDIINSIILYEHLNELPMYVLTDERFWNWINFNKGYQVALKTMPIKKDNSVVKDHWLFTQGKRRGLFFGVLSRSYFRVALTIDEKAEDKYEMTRFVIDKPERFRNLSWRSFSSQKHIVMGTLKAEKRIYEEYGDIEKAKYFTEIAKHISKLGSVMLLDAMTEEDIYEYVYKYYRSIIQQT